MGVTRASLLSDYPVGETLLRAVGATDTADGRDPSRAVYTMTRSVGSNFTPSGDVGNLAPSVRERGASCISQGKSETMDLESNDCLTNWPGLEAMTTANLAVIALPGRTVPPAGGGGGDIRDLSQHQTAHPGRVQ
ncbi:hypothetical protein PoB_003085100 [Plakobranchus ocellatus]|uniref:Uncharacterized protein n=1 Tax=Plakobranchus ocellatus TaxID=259542 RepID=A0AAV3ZZD9_9GAST|nr:hypothetical protein PoB_003085100 [Plakobranchus ocellatus]